jgi:hypothetical protein
VTGANVAFSNGIETVRTFQADRNIEGADPGINRATGQVTERFTDTMLLTQTQHSAAAHFAFLHR